ncbi:hypothetical protein O0L34_g15385 [Tuta absoluta]|nr:hypothetical protein O0L34_g15385 [Tuta absoluta]
MLGWFVLCLLTLRFNRVSSQGECTDLRGRVIANGLHYAPGPDTCTLCVCDNGLPKICKAVLCSPPQDCRSFRVGNTCCEFICLDDVVKPAEGAEANVRVAAGGAAAVVLLTVALVVYRVKKQKRRRAPHTDDQRSLTSIGYISGSMAYMGGQCETALAAWKPPGNYLPRGEAPPPYDEAVAQCRQEALSRGSNESAYHRTYPINLENLPRPDDIQCSGHSYVNMQRPVQQMANTQNCYNAPLLQPVHPEPREQNPMPHHPLAPNMVGFPSAIRLTGSLGAISNRGLLSLLQREPEPERPHNVPGFYTNAPIHTSLHRTIPRISTAIDTTILDTSIAGFNRTDRGLPAEIRRSFHKPSERRDTGRSMPRNLNIVTADHTHARHRHEHDGSNIRISASGVNSTINNSMQIPAGRRDSPDGSEGKSGVKPPPPPPKPQENPVPHPTLPLTVDKPSCVCSYSGTSGAAASSGAGGGEAEGEGEGEGGEEGEDADDFRSECENCKAASNSRWVVEEGWPGEEDEGTQTLQRRAPPPAPPPPATATLPQPVTKQTRVALGPPSNWENWFNTIPDSDTDSDE